MDGLILPAVLVWSLAVAAVAAHGLLAGLLRLMAAPEERGTPADVAPGLTSN